MFEFPAPNEESCLQVTDIYDSFEGECASSRINYTAKLRDGSCATIFLASQLRTLTPTLITMTMLERVT